MEVRLFQTANIIADTYKTNMEDIIFTRIMVKSYGKQANSRILVLNSNKEVLIDNYNSYIGKILNNKETRSGIKGQSKSGLYKVDDKEILQLSVPITMNDGLETKIIGAVLISTSMEQLSHEIDDLKNNMLKIAISALGISIILTFFAANSITKPLRDLNDGVDKLSSGDLGYTIPKTVGGEIGILIETFNEMSDKLNKIEKNRKAFINTISHELKTPLTSIKVLIESLSLGNNDLETYREYFMDIHGETERMEDLVNYLMSSIKLEDIILDIKEENLKEILEDTVRLIEPYADKNGVILTINNPEDILVNCDKDRIKEVILNLIDNGIKYRDEGKNQNYVSITFEKSKEKGFIIIEDNGLGIADEDLPNIFQRDFRVLDGIIQSKKNIEGYGIGLALVSNIIDKHSWDISAKSTLGIGSIFTITIPL